MSACLQTTLSPRNTTRTALKFRSRMSDMFQKSALATIGLIAAGSIIKANAIALDHARLSRRGIDSPSTRSIGAECDIAAEGAKQYCTENYKAFVTCSSGTFQIAGLYEGIAPAEAVGECCMKNQECGYLPGDDTVSYHSLRLALHVWTYDTDTASYFAVRLLWQIEHGEVYHQGSLAV